jgi:NADH:ubiquinone oxidoreductase subunit 2 (subunit N)
LFFSNLLTSFSTNPLYGITLIYLNVYTYVYILYILFSVLFLYDIKKIKTLSFLKVLNRYNFISFTVVLAFLSMSGIPPLAGFTGKFLLFNFLFLTQKYICIIVFSFLNFFSIYFYIQNLRFLISKTQPNCFLIGGFYIFLNKKLVNILVFFNFFNFFVILYFEDILYFFLNICLYKNTF